MANVGTLVVDLRTNSAAFVNDMARARAATERTAKGMETAMAGASRAFSTLGRVAAGLGVALSVDALVAFGQRTINAAGAMSDLADQLGLTTDQLQLYRFAALQSGTSSEVLEQSLIRFQDTMGQALQGNDQAIASFQRVGVSLLNASGQARGMNDVYTETITKLMQIPNVATRVSNGSDIMGRGFARMQPTFVALTTGMEDTRREAERTGQFIDRELIQRAKVLSDRWAAAAGSLERTLLPILVALAEAAERFGRGLAGLDPSRIFTGGVMDLLTGGGQTRLLGNILDGVNRNLAETQRLAADAQEAVSGLLRLPADNPLRANLAQTQQDLSDLQRDIVRLQSERERLLGFMGRPPTSQAVIPPPPATPGVSNPLGVGAGRDAAREAERAAAAQRRLLEGYRHTLESLEPLGRETRAYSDTLLDLDGMRARDIVSMSEHGRLINVARQQFHDASLRALGLSEAFEATVTAADRLEEQLGALDFAFSAGLISSDRYSDMLTEIQLNASGLGKAFDRLGSDIASSIEGAITKWEGFNSLLGNILQNIGRVLIQASITDPLKAALPDVLRSVGRWIFGTPSASAFGNIIGPHGPMPLTRFAGGGVVNSPHLAMFGEGSGPEAFIPLRDGGIPVHIRGDAGRQRGGDVYLSIDARGAEPGAAIRIEAVAQRAALKMRDAMYDDMERGGRLARASGRRRK